MKFMYRLLVFLLGFIMGVTGCIGGLIGGIYYAYTNVKLVDIIGSDFPFVVDGPNSITNMTPQEIVSKLMALMSGDIGTITLGNLQSTYGLDLSKLLGFDIPESVLNEWALDALFEEDGLNKFLEYVTVGSALDLLDAFGVSIIRDYFPLAAEKLENVKLSVLMEDNGWLQLLDPLTVGDLIPEVLLDLLWNNENLRGIYKFVLAVGGINVGELVRAILKLDDSKPLLNVIVETESVSEFDLSELIPEGTDSLAHIKNLIKGITIGMLFEEDAEGNLKFTYYKALEQITVGDVLDLICIVSPDWFLNLSRGMQLHIRSIENYSLFYVLYTKVKVVVAPEEPIEGEEPVESEEPSEEQGVEEIQLRPVIDILKILLGDLVVDDIVRTIYKMLNGNEELGSLYDYSDIIGNLYDVLGEIRVIDLIEGIMNNNFDNIITQLKNTTLGDLIGSYFDKMYYSISRDARQALDKLLTVTVGDIIDAFKGNSESLTSKLNDVKLVGIISLVIYFVEEYVIKKTLPENVKEVLNVFYKNFNDITVKVLVDEIFKGKLDSLRNGLYNYTVNELLDLVFIVWEDWNSKLTDRVRLQIEKIGELTIREILEDGDSNRTVVQVFEIILGDLNIDDLIRTIVKFVKGEEDMSFIDDLSAPVKKVYEVISGINLIGIIKAISEKNLNEIIDEDIREVSIYDFVESLLEEFLEKLSDRSRQALIGLLKITIGDIVDTIDYRSSESIFRRIGNILIVDLLYVFVDLIKSETELPEIVETLIDIIFGSLDSFTIKALFDEVLYGNFDSILENGLYTITVGEILDPLFMADFIDGIENESLKHIVTVIYGAYSVITIGEIVKDYKVLFQALTYITVGDLFGDLLGYEYYDGVWTKFDDEDRLEIFERFANETIYDILFDFDYLSGELLHEITFGDLLNAIHYLLCAYEADRAVLEVGIVEKLFHNATPNFYKMLERFEKITISSFIHRYIECEEDHDVLGDEEIGDAFGNGSVGDLLSLIFACFDIELRLDDAVWTMDGDDFGAIVSKALNILLLDVFNRDWENVFGSFSLKDIALLIEEVLLTYGYFPEFIADLDTYNQLLANLDNISLYQLLVNLGLIEGEEFEYDYLDIILDLISFGMIIDDIIYFVFDERRKDLKLTEYYDLDKLLQKILDNMRSFYLLEIRELLDTLEYDGAIIFLREITKEIFNEITVREFIEAFFGKDWEPDFVDVNSDLFKEIMGLKIWELFDYIFDYEFMEITVGEILDLIDLESILIDLGIGWLYGLIILFLGDISLDDLIYLNLDLILSHITIGDIIDTCIDYDLFTEEELGDIVFTDAELYILIRSVFLIDIYNHFFTDDKALDSYGFDTVTIADVIDMFYRPGADIALNALYINITGLVISIICDCIESGNFDVVKDAVRGNSLGDLIKLITALYNEIFETDFDFENEYAEYALLVKLFNNLDLVLFEYMFDREFDTEYYDELIVRSILDGITLADLYDAILTLVFNESDGELDIEMYIAPTLKKILDDVMSCALADLIYDETSVIQQFFEVAYVGDFVEAIIWYIEEYAGIDTSVAESYETIALLRENLNGFLLIDLIGHIRFEEFTEILSAILKDVTIGMILMDIFTYNDAYYEGNAAYDNFVTILLADLLSSESIEEVYTDYLQSVKFIDVLDLILLMFDDLSQLYAENIADRLDEIISELLDVYLSDYEEIALLLEDLLYTLTYEDLYLILAFYVPEIEDEVAGFRPYLKALWEGILPLSIYPGEDELLELESVFLSAQLGFVVDILYLFFGDTEEFAKIDALCVLINDAVIRDLYNAINDGAFSDIMNASMLEFTEALFGNKTFGDLLNILVNDLGKNYEDTEFILNLFADRKLSVIFGDPTPVNIFGDIVLGDIIGEILVNVLGWEQLHGDWVDGILYNELVEYVNMTIVDLLDELLGDIPDYYKTLIAIFDTGVFMTVYVKLYLEFANDIEDFLNSTLADFLYIILDEIPTELPEGYTTLDKIVENLDKITVIQLLKDIFGGDFDFCEDLLFKIIDAITLGDVIYDIETFTFNELGISILDPLAPALIDIIDHIGKITLIRLIEDPSYIISDLINYVTIGHIIDTLFYYIGTIDEDEIEYETIRQLLDNLGKLAVVDLIYYINQSEIEEMVEVVFGDIDLGMVVRDIFLIIGYDYDEEALLKNKAYAELTAILIIDLIFSLELTIEQFMDEVTVDDVKELIILLAGVQETIDEYIAPKIQEIISDILNFFLSDLSEIQYFTDILGAVTWGDVIEIIEFYCVNFFDYSFELEISYLSYDARMFIKGLRSIEVSDLDGLSDYLEGTKLGVIIDIISIFIDNEYFLAFADLVRDAVIIDLIDSIDKGAFDDIMNGSLEAFTSALFTNKTIGDVIEILESFDVVFEGIEHIIDLFKNVKLSALLGNPMPENVFGDIVLGDIIGEFLGWDNVDGDWVDGFLFSLLEEYANTTIVDILLDFFGEMHEYVQTAIVVGIAAACGLLYLLYDSYLSEHVERILDTSLRNLIEDILDLFGIEIPEDYVTLNIILENLDRMTLRELIDIFSEADFDIFESIIYVFLDGILLSDVIYDIDTLLEQFIGERYIENLAPSIVDVINHIGKISLVGLLDDPTVILTSFNGYANLGHIVDAVLYYIGIREIEIESETIAKILTNIRSMLIVDCFNYITDLELEDLFAIVLDSVKLNLIVMDLCRIFEYDLSSEVQENNAYRKLVDILLFDLIFNFMDTINLYVGSVTADEVKELVVLLADLQEVIDEYVAPKIQEIISDLLNFFLEDYSDTQYFVTVLKAVTWGDLLEIADFYCILLTGLSIETDITNLPFEARDFVNGLRPIYVYDIDNLIEYISETKLAVIISFVTVVYDNPYFVELSTLIKDATIGGIYDAITGGAFDSIDNGSLLKLTSALFGDKDISDLVYILRGFQIDFSEIEFITNLFSDLKLADLFGDPTPEKVFSDITLGDIVGELLGWEKKDGSWEVSAVYSFLDEYANKTIVEIINEFFEGLLPYLQSLIALAVLTVCGVLIVLYNRHLFKEVDKILNSSVKALIERILNEFDCALPDHYRSLNKILYNLDRMVLEGVINDFAKGIDIFEGFIYKIIDEVTFADVIYDFDTLINELTGTRFTDHLAPSILNIIDTVGALTLVEFLKDYDTLPVNLAGYITLGHVISAILYYLGKEESEIKYETIRQLINNTKAMVLADLIEYFDYQETEILVRLILNLIDLGMIVRDICLAFDCVITEDIRSNNAYAVFTSLFLVDVIYDIDGAFDNFLLRVTEHDILELIIAILDMHIEYDDYVAPRLQAIIYDLLNIELYNYSETEHYELILKAVTWGDMLEISEFYFVEYGETSIEAEIAEMPYSVREFIDGIRLINVYDYEALYNYLLDQKLKVVIGIIEIFYNDQKFTEMASLIEDAVIRELIQAVKGGAFSNIGEGTLLYLTEALFDDKTVYDVVYTLGNIGIDLSEFEHITDLFRELRLSNLFGDPTPEKVFGNITLGDLVGKFLGWDYVGGEWLVSSIFTFVEEYANMTMVDILDKIFGDIIHDYLQTLIVFGIAVVCALLVVVLTEPVEKFLDKTIYSVVMSIADAFGFTFPNEYKTLNQILYNLDQITFRSLFVEGFSVLDDLIYRVFDGIAVSDIIYDIFTIVKQVAEVNVTDHLAPSIIDIIDTVGALTLIEFFKNPEALIDNFLGYATFGHLTEALFWYFDKDGVFQARLPMNIERFLSYIENILLNDYEEVYKELAVVTLEDVVDLLIAIFDHTFKYKDYVSPTLENVVRRLLRVSVVDCVQFEHYKDTFLKITYYELFDILDWYTGWQREIDKLPEKVLADIQDKLWLLEIGDVDGLVNLFKDITVEHLLLIGNIFVGDQSIHDIINRLACIFDVAKIYSLATVDSYNGFIGVLFGDSTLEPILTVLIDYSVVPSNLSELVHKFDNVSLARLFTEPTPTNIFLNNSLGDYLGNLLDWTFENNRWESGIAFLHNFFGYDIVNMTVAGLLNLTGLNEYLQTAIALDIIIHAAILVYVYNEFFAERVNDTLNKSIKHFIEVVFDWIKVKIPDRYVTLNKLLANLDKILLKDLLKDLFGGAFDAKDFLTDATKGISVADAIFDIIRIIEDNTGKSIIENIAPTLVDIINKVFDTSIISILVYENYVDAALKITYFELFDILDWYTGWQREIDKNLPEKFLSDIQDKLWLLEIGDIDGLKILGRSVTIEHVMLFATAFINNESISNLIIDISGIFDGARIGTLVSSGSYREFIQELFGIKTLEPVIDILVNLGLIPADLIRLVRNFDNVLLYNVFADPTPKNIFLSYSLGDYVGYLLGWEYNGSYWNSNISLYHNLGGHDIVNMTLEDLLALTKLGEYVQTALAAGVVIILIIAYVALNEILTKTLDLPVKAIFKLFGFDYAKYNTLKQLVENLEDITWKDVFTSSLSTTIRNILDKIDLGLILSDFYKVSDEVKLNNAYITLSSVLVYDLLSNPNGVWTYVTNIITVSDIIKLVILIADKDKKVEAYVAPEIQSVVYRIFDVVVAKVFDTNHYVAALKTIQYWEILDAIDWYTGVRRNIDKLSTEVVDLFDEFLNLYVYDYKAVGELLKTVKIAHVLDVINYFVNNGYIKVLSEIIGGATIYTLYQVRANRNAFVAELFGHATLKPVIDIVINNKYVDEKVGNVLRMFDNVTFYNIFVDPTPANIFFDNSIGDYIGPVLNWTKNSEGKYQINPAFLHNLLGLDFINDKVVDVLSLLEISDHNRTGVAVTIVAAAAILYTLLKDFINKLQTKSIYNLVNEILKIAGVDLTKPIYAKLLANANNVTYKQLFSEFKESIKKLLDGISVYDISDMILKLIGYGGILDRNEPIVKKLIANLEAMGLYSLLFEKFEFKKFGKDLLNNITIGELVEFMLVITNKRIKADITILATYQELASIKINDIIDNHNKVFNDIVKVISLGGLFELLLTAVNKIKDFEPGSLESKIIENLKSYTVKDFLDGSPSLMTAMFKGISVGEVMGYKLEIDILTGKEIWVKYDIGGNRETIELGVVVKIMNQKLDDLINGNVNFERIINDSTIGELLDTSNSAILRDLKDSTIGNIEDGIRNVSINALNEDGYVGNGILKLLIGFDYKKGGVSTPITLGNLSEALFAKVQVATLLELITLGLFTFEGYQNAQLMDIYNAITTAPLDFSAGSEIDGILKAVSGNGFYDLTIDQFIMAVFLMLDWMFANGTF